MGIFSRRRRNERRRAQRVREEALRELDATKKRLEERMARIEALAKEKGVDLGATEED